MVSLLVLISQTPEQRLQRSKRQLVQLDSYKHLNMGFLAGIHFYFNHRNHQTANKTNKEMPQCKLSHTEVGTYYRISVAKQGVKRLNTNMSVLIFS